MVDRELLSHKLHLLSKSIGKLEKYREVSLAELVANEERRDAIERVLHVTVQACLDIGNHVIADLDLREPADYKDIMVVLTEAGILPNDRLDQFKRMAQFRNVIVHQYDTINPEIILSIVQNNTDDLRLFGQLIKTRFDL